MVEPTFVLGEETFKKTGWICFTKCQVRMRHDQPGMLVFRRQKLWHPPSGNLRHAKFVVQNVFCSLTALAICFTVKRLSSITMCWTRFSWMVAVAGRPDLRSSSRLCLPLLSSTAHFCTVDKPGACLHEYPLGLTSPHFLQIFDNTTVPNSFRIPDPVWVYMEGNNAVSIRKGWI